MSAPRSYRVIVIERVFHDAFITADSPEAAEAEALRLWGGTADMEIFDTELEGILVEEIDSKGGAA